MSMECLTQQKFVQSTNNSILFLDFTFALNIGYVLTSSIIAKMDAPMINVFLGAETGILKGY